MRGHLHWICLGVLAQLGCDAGGSSPHPPPSEGSAGSSSGTVGSGPILGGGPIIIGPGPGPDPRVDLGAECDPTREVDPDSEALLVRDPEILARFTLERVLARIVASAQVETTPLTALQRLFDTENDAEGGVFADNVHCDDALNPAFDDAPAVDCPRAEAALASSPDLLAEGEPNGFVPIALVNHFELVSPNLTTCGNYDIVFAKRSGAGAVSDRVLLAFQGWLPNPGTTLASCRPVAELWAGLASEPDIEQRAAALQQLFFDGLPGFEPVIDAVHYGLGTRDCGWDGCGQIRVAQGMQEPFQFREFRPAVAGASGTPELFFFPTRLPRVPRADLFDPALGAPLGDNFRAQLAGGVVALVNTSLPHVGYWSSSIYEAGESSVSGPAAPSYLARVRESARGVEVLDQLEAAIVPETVSDCPGDDPISGEALLQRITALSCAGCHAPAQTIVPDRGIGCGQAWPSSLGVSHIDEQGEVSEALRQVFLPHRAGLLSLYLQACAGAQVYAAFGLSPPQGQLPIP